MSNRPKVQNYPDLQSLAVRLRDDLNNEDFVLLYAHNGTGKTRLSMEFKNRGKLAGGADTLYFNAYTEDLFHWDNDLDNDEQPTLNINSDSRFFDGFKELALEDKIFDYLQRYAEFNFKIDYENWKIIFSKTIKNPDYRANADQPETIVSDYIKISRGEETIFIWCIYLAVCQLATDGQEAYGWVKYFYIDDPVSSLDENNAIAVASDLSKLLFSAKGKIKAIVSSHHTLFFNVMCNELKRNGVKRYFLHKNGIDGYTLQKTTDTPFFHHVALLVELKQAALSDNIKTYHFNILRSILEKTSSFLGYNDFGKCVDGIDDHVLLERALNLLSHGAYSMYEPVEMLPETKELFKKILNGFLDKYQFDLPELVNVEPEENN